MGRFGGPYFCAIVCAMTGDKKQLDKFKEAARELETDDDPARFKDRVDRLVKHRPVPKPKD